MKLPIIFLFLFILLFSVFHEIDCYSCPPPRALLVQLASEQRKIAYYDGLNKPEEASKVRKEAHKVIDMLRKNFSAYSFPCPVYFYIDTNAHFIKEKQFNKALLDSSLKPANNIVINQNDSIYFIVCYADPTSLGLHTPKHKNFVILNKDYEEIDNLRNVHELSTWADSADNYFIRLYKQSKSKTRILPNSETTY